MDTVIEMYVGMTAGTSEETKKRIVGLINERHPDASLIAIVNGYWSGINEKTYRIKVVSILGKAQATIALIKSQFDVEFVAIDEPYK